MVGVYLRIRDARWQEQVTALLRQRPQLRLVDDARDADVVLAAAEPEWTPDAAESGPPVLVMAAHPQPEWLEEGARGVIPLDAAGDELESALRAVAYGLVVLPPELVPAFARPLRSVEPLPEPLTPREVEVLRHLAHGTGNKIIAYELGISEHTVKFHVAQLMQKLRAGSRTEAVTRGVRLGLVPL
jgi:DNA-binding NarL/FixJ family response regulator